MADESHHCVYLLDQMMETSRIGQILKVCRIGEICGSSCVKNVEETRIEYQ